ncbi:MAG: transporter ATP-binding protein, partial [Bacillales bacterium]|nr:transporter ATP-binding protein [Bacillales bacterium]
EDISFYVNKGEIVGLIGPNGSGKTTLIRLITGLAKIDSGSIKLSGISVSDQFEKSIAQIGAIIENPNFYEYMSGWDNLKLYADMYESISDDRIQEVVNLTRLSKRIHDDVASYSLGMKQRLGIAQAILHSPRILVLDEPTNGLDPAGIRELREHLTYLSKVEGISILISTHLLHEVETLCDRVVIIQQGKILAEKTVQPEESEETITLTIQTTEIERACKLLSENYTLTSNDNSHISLRVKFNQIPQVNKLLVQQEIPVFKLAVVDTSLEETFIQMTNEGNDLN